MLWLYHWGKAAPRIPRSCNSAQFTPWPSRPILAQATRPLLRHSNPTVSPLQASLFPSGSHLEYGLAIPTATHTHPGQTYGAYLALPGSVTTAEPPVQVAQQIRPQNEGQQVRRPVATQQEAPPQGLRFEDVRRMIEDGLVQRRPEAPKYTKSYPPKIDQTPLPRNYRPLHGPVLGGRFGLPEASFVRSLSDRCGVLVVHKPSTEFGEGLV
ncbi:unnamed protein product [Prunus armeniaca]